MSNSIKEDLELYQAFRNKGDERLVKKYESFIFKKLLQLTQNEETAKDLTQEVFLNLLKGSEYRGESKFTTWLYRIILNVWRDDKRRKNKSQDELVELREIEEKEGEPDRIIENLPISNIWKLIGDILSKSGEGEREGKMCFGILQLYFGEYGEHTFQEIADKLGCSISTVYYLINRNLKILQKGMKRREIRIKLGTYFPFNCTIWR